jgi:hypothetical protein
MIAACGVLAVDHVVRKSMPRRRMGNQGRISPDY